MDEPTSGFGLRPPDRDLHGPRKGVPEYDGYSAPAMGMKQRTFRFFESATGHIPVSVHVSPVFQRHRRPCRSIDTTRAARLRIGRRLGLTGLHALPILYRDGESRTMRRIVWILMATLCTTGCGHKGAVSTSELQSSFKSAEPAIQALVDKAVGAVKSNNYPEALGDLQTLSHKARLTPDQQQTIK